MSVRPLESATPLPLQLALELEGAIRACRRQTGWGPRLVAGATGCVHSTVRKVLKRAGISRPPRAVKEPAYRYEWPCPGDLLQMDVVSRYARFLRPGHAVTRDCHRTADEKRAAVGYDYAHAIVDDHSRFADVELHDDEQAATVTALRRTRARPLRRARDRREAADDRRMKVKCLDAAAVFCQSGGGCG